MYSRSKNKAPTEKKPKKTLRRLLLFQGHVASASFVTTRLTNAQI